jgi:membrane associated rhomboid family serine protease
MRATLLISIVIVIVFLLQIAFEGMTEYFLLDSTELIARPWILITSMFLHGGITHLIYNLLALVIFGLILENIIGTRRFWILYFAGGIIAGIAAAILYPASLGASGAIFAVLGTLAVLRPRMIVWTMYIPLPMAIAAIVWIAIDLIGIIAPSGTANAAHIAGLLFGVIVGFALRKRHGERAAPHIPGTLSERQFKKWEDEWM